MAFEASTSSGQGGTSTIQGVAGTDAGGAANQNDSGIKFIVRHGGSGTEREAYTIKKDGNIHFPNGQGISFAATSDAGGMTSELLDDYEEGNWTPTSGSPEYWTSVVGTYVKIGRMVHAAFQVVQNGGGGNLMRIDLPFACANSEASRNGVFFGYNQWDAGTYHQLAGNVNKGAADFYFYRMDGSGSDATYNQLGSGKVLKGVVCYQTA